MAKKKLKLSKKGLQSLRNGMKKCHQSEGYKNRDFSWLKTPERRALMSESNRRRWKEGKMKDPFEDDFEVVVKERPNDYCGVVTENDYKEMLG